MQYLRKHHLLSCTPFVFLLMKDIVAWSCFGLTPYLEVTAYNAFLNHKRHRPLNFYLTRTHQSCHNLLPESLLGF
jgi:hypothetical protein